MQYFEALNAVLKDTTKVIRKSSWYDQTACVFMRKGSDIVADGTSNIPAGLKFKVEDHLCLLKKEIVTIIGSDISGPGMSSSYKYKLKVGYWPSADDALDDDWIILDEIPIHTN